MVDLLVLVVVVGGCLLRLMIYGKQVEREDEMEGETRGFCASDTLPP